MDTVTLICAQFSVPETASYPVNLTRHASIRTSEALVVRDRAYLLYDFHGQRMLLHVAVCLVRHTWATNIWRPNPVVVVDKKGRLARLATQVKE